MNTRWFTYGWLGLLLGLMACTERVDPAVGRIYNGDHSFSVGMEPDRQPLGIVFATEVGPDSAYAYVVSLTECSLPLSADRHYLAGDTSVVSFDGLTGTALWRDSLSYGPLMEQLDRYGEGWFIPTVGEWRLLRDSFQLMNDRLAKLSGADVLCQGQYWCTTAHAEPAYGYCAVAYDMYSDTFGLFNRADSCRVRPMRRVLLKGSLWTKWTENKTFII